MGNILTQKRNGGGTSATALDELTYNYHTTTDGLVSNRLYQVNDVVSAGNYTDDIDDQGTFNNTHSTIETANNYGYDELGNLVRDVQEEIASIEWTVYGKMKKITRNSGSTKADLEFGYDASGNRLWKKVTPKGSGAVTSTYYYLRDAQGNEMCRYVKYTNTSSQLMYVAQEHSIYGSSRVGVDNRKDTLYKAGSYSPAWGGVGASRRELGLKSFELANHLGNVLVTVSDKPVYKVSSGTIYFNPEITSSSDYYPFGAPIQGRSFSSAEYRFGFNGQEKDDEISGSGNSYAFEYRMHDPRLGRWLSVDIAIKTGIQSEIRKLVERGQFSISPYAFARNIPTWFVDYDGNLEHPVKGVPAGRVRISSQFGWRKDPLNSSNLQGHGGVDYAVPEGTKVYAVGGGTVVRADYSKSYGNVVIIKHDNGTFSLYAHNSKLNVKVGQEVGEGENISLSGNTGNRTTGAHLHFEIIKGINLQFNSPNEPNSVYNNINKIDPKGKNIGGTTNQDFDKILDAQTDQIKQKDGVTIKDVENNR